MSMEILADMCRKVAWEKAVVVFTGEWILERGSEGFSGFGSDWVGDQCSTDLSL